MSLMDVNIERLLSQNTFYWRVRLTCFDLENADSIALEVQRLVRILQRAPGAHTFQEAGNNMTLNNCVDDFTRGCGGYGKLRSLT